MSSDIKAKLYVVPTPIGNLKDITLRALEVFEAADVIAAEDTRQSLKLLNHFNIKKPLISYHMHNENMKSDDLMNMIRDGKTVALVSDAGTPGISDPGSVVIKKCIEEDIPFEVLPGATAVTTALVNSGLSTNRFIFIGFVPRENKDRNYIVEEYKDRRETLVFYEAPHRLLNTLQFLLNNFGNRRMAVCRELTKLHEEIIRDTIENIIKHYEKNQTKGEYVLVMSGKTEEEIEIENKQKWEEFSIEEHIKKYLNEGLSKKEAIKKVSKERNLPKSEVYKFSIDL